MLPRKNISIEAPSLLLFSRLEYVVSFLNNHPLKPAGVELGVGLSNASVYIRYSNETGRLLSSAFVIPPQGCFFQNKELPFPLYANIYSLGKQSVYAVETEDRLPGAFLRGRFFQFDILETLFFYISRIEELNPNPSTEQDRYFEGRQFLVRNGLYREAVADQLVAAFFRVLGLGVPLPDTRFIWTHDIDALRKFPSFYKFFRAIARLLLRKQWRALLLLFRAYYRSLNKKEYDPFDTFEWLFLKREGMEKIAFLMAGGLTRYDNHYRIDGAETKQAIRLALRRGYRIGLHPSYACWINRAQFVDEKRLLEAVIGQEVKRSRQHFLNFSIPHTISLLEEAGITEDHSLGFRSHIGFRCGTGFPYRLYNFEKERESTVTEAPLVIMDSAIVAEAKKKEAEPFNFLKDFLEKNRKGTQISVNFHNSSFDGVEWDRQQMKRLYALIQEYFPGGGG